LPPPPATLPFFCRFHAACFPADAARLPLLRRRAASFATPITPRFSRFQFRFVFCHFSCHATLSLPFAIIFDCRHFAIFATPRHFIFRYLRLRDVCSSPADTLHAAMPLRRSVTLAIRHCLLTFHTFAAFFDCRWFHCLQRLIIIIERHYYAACLLPRLITPLCRLFYHIILPPPFFAFAILRCHAVIMRFASYHCRHLRHHIARHDFRPRCAFYLLSVIFEHYVCLLRLSFFIDFSAIFHFISYYSFFITLPFFAAVSRFSLLLLSLFCRLMPPSPPETPLCRLLPRDVGADVLQQRALPRRRECRAPPLYSDDIRLPPFLCSFARRARYTICRRCRWRGS